MKGKKSRNRKIPLIIFFLIYIIFITFTPIIITNAGNIDTTFTPRPNLPPDKPILIYPPNGSKNITLPVLLQVLVYDNTSQKVHVYFYNATDDMEIGHQTVNSGTIASVTWDGLERGKNYSWYAVASDLEYTNTSAVWNFSTKPNSPPIIHDNEYPSNGSTKIERKPNCRIEISDNDSDLMTIYWYENTTGNWVLRKVTGMVGNGTYSWRFKQAQKHLTTYYWKVVVNDSYDETTATFHFTTEAPRPSNKNPVANITGPSWGYVNQTLTFYANNSYDPDGHIVGYRWDFNNDGLFDTDWRYSVIGTCNYSIPGNYTVKLQVVDDDGETDVDTHMVTILPLKPPLQLPIAEANGPYTGFINETIVFTSNGSYDPDGIITNYTWKFGDNHTSYLKNPAHIYNKSGNYTVILTVRDNDNLTNTDTTNVYVKKVEKEKPPGKKEQPLLWLIFLIISVISAMIALYILSKRYKTNRKIKKLESIHTEIEKLNIENIHSKIDKWR